MKRKNYSTKIFNSNKTLGDIMELNKENIYFLETEQSSDDVACDSDLLIQMKDSGLTMDATIQQLVAVIVSNGINPMIKETQNIDPNWTIDHLVNKVEGFEDWDLFDNVVIYTGQDIELRLENNQEEEDELLLC